MSQHSQEVSISTSVVQEDLIRLLYRFDAKKPWQTFKEGAPHRSSVEKGKQATSSKLKKIYVAKKNRFQRRKNAAFNNICDRRFGSIQQFFDTHEKVEVPQEWATLLKNSDLKKWRKWTL